MLVLSRKKSERILIGDIEIMIVAIHRDSVRIGITAPKEVSISRPEASGPTDRAAKE